MLKFYLMFNPVVTYTNLLQRLHYIYLLYAIPMVLVTAALIPPFQNPDEPNHFLRAEQVSRMELIPAFHHQYDTNAVKTAIPADSLVLYPTPGGFKADASIIAAASIFSPVEAQANVKVTDNMFFAARQIKWGTGITYFNFGNTAIYPPVVYLMPALGTALGKLLHLSVIRTLFIARLLNAALAVTLSFFALLLAKRSKILLFIALLFPMVIELFASVSQDAILISCAFLLVAIIDRAEFHAVPKYQRWQIFTLIILMSLIGMAKPPYALCAVVFLFLSMKPKVKVALLGVPFLVIATWLYLDLANLSVIFAPPSLRINAKLQALHILQHPFSFLSMFFDIDKVAVLANIRSFIGILGWLDTSLTLFYYFIAFLILVLGFVMNARFKTDNHFWLRIAALTGVVITIVALMTVQYITWTALDSPVLNGMQGRYLLPVFPFLALALCGSAVPDKLNKLKMVLYSLILLFPLFTLISLTQLLISRYYC